MSELVLPYPPSLNRYWRSITVGGRARVVISREGRDYRIEAHAACLRAGLPAPIAGLPFALEITVYRPQRRGDLDNTAKAILDALSKRLYADDSQVELLLLRRREDKHNPRAEVRWWTLDASEPIDTRQVSAVRASLTSER